MAEQPSEPDPRSWLERFEAVTDRPAPPRWIAPAATLLAGVICSAVAAATGRGTSGVLGGLLAAVVVLAFSSSSAFPMRLSQDLGDRRGLGLALLLINYATRLAAALLVLALAVGLGDLDQRTVGIAVIVCALVRINVQVGLIGHGLRT